MSKCMIFSYEKKQSTQYFKLWSFLFLIYKIKCSKTRPLCTSAHKISVNTVPYVFFLQINT